MIFVFRAAASFARRVNSVNVIEEAAVSDFDVRLSGGLVGRVGGGRVRSVSLFV